MAGSYKADHGMSKWSLKFVCQYFVCYDRNIDRSIATYMDQFKIMSYWDLKSMYHPGSFKTFFLYVA